MSMYRNQFFLLGILLLLLGIQFRMVDSFVLNESTTRTLARISEKTTVADNSAISNLMMQIYPKPMKRVQPPRWFGLAMIAVGAVVSLHAISLPRFHRG